MTWRGEVEDGLGWGGLVPSREKREQEHEDARRMLQVKVLRAERDHARAQFEEAIKLLTGIHSLMYPAPTALPDGRVMVFRPTSPDPHDVLQALSDRIRALPDELEKLRAASVIPNPPLA